jgi:hypothetical protein
VTDWRRNPRATSRQLWRLNHEGLSVESVFLRRYYVFFFISHESRHVGSRRLGFAPRIAPGDVYVRPRESG